MELKEVSLLLEDKLKSWFGFDNFKAGQKEIIKSVLDSNHTLGILPTGSGKSLCYQMATYELQQSTLIISPLISLMDDQVAQLKMSGEQSVAYIHSGMDDNEKNWNMKRLAKSRFIFLSPEFILQPQNFKLISTIDFGLIVLDEAHCISEWGYDFRPHYALISKITNYYKNATILALTATAPPHLEQDLNQLLNVSFHVIKTHMNRPNISFQHINFRNDQEKMNWLMHYIEQSGPTIIYVSSKKMCVELAKTIYKHGYLTGIYHGDLSYQERQTVQQQFINNDIPVIVATSAFGMGVNKKDIRTVIHFHLSTSPSSYLQEIGRAGRDQQPSQAISLFQPDDRYLLETILFADMILPYDIDCYELGANIEPLKQDILEILHSHFTYAQLKQIFQIAQERKQLALNRILSYSQLDQCRRKYLLEFFGEVPDIPSICCDHDTDIKPLKIYNRKKVKRQMSYEDKLKNLFLS